jgi:hypothetical protein
MPGKFGLFNPFVVFDLAIADADNSVRPLCNIGFVGNYYNRVTFRMEFFKKRHNFDARL